MPKLIAVVLIVAFAGCAGPRRKPTTAAAPPAPIKARCLEKPQWTTKDEQGNDIGIYVCFGDESKLLYTARIIPPAPKANPAKSPKKAL